MLIKSLSKIWLGGGKYKFVKKIKQMKHIGFTLVVLLLAGCSKERRLVNKLEGKWNIEKIFFDGEQMVVSQSVVKFDDCKDTDKCEGNMYLYSVEDQEGQSTNFDYTIENDAKSITMKPSFDGDMATWDLDVDLDGDDLILDGTGIEIYSGGSDSYRIRIELKKED